jgi:signal peptidase II
VSNAPKKSPADKPAGGQGNGDVERAKPGPPPAASISDGPLHASRYLIYFGLAIVGCSIDLMTKQAVFRWRGLPRQGNEWWLIEGRFGIETSVNRGALFGLGEGYWWVFATLSVVALVGIFTWLFVYRAAHDRWLTVALGFVSGGILGNLYDRLGLWDSRGLPEIYHHGVRDWILFVWPEIKLRMFNPWPNFNIADSLLVTGAIMLLLHAVVWREVKQPPAEA